MVRTIEASTPSEPVLAAFHARLRARRTWLFLSFLSMLTVPALVGWLLDSDGALLVAAVCFGASAFCAGTALQMTQCPRCHGLVFVRGITIAPSSTCRHCGLNLSRDRSQRGAP